MPIIRREWLQNSPQESPLRLADEAFATTTPLKAPRGNGGGGNPNLDDETLAAAAIPIYNLDEEIPAADRTHRQLTLIAPDLTDVEVLRQLAEVARSLHAERVSLNEFVKAIYVVGPGAEYSATHPYRSPEAQKIRDGLWDLGMNLIEPPPGVATGKAGIRRFMAARFMKQRQILEQHSQRR